MKLEEFVQKVDGFSSLGPTEKIRLFAWYLHRYNNNERFVVSDLMKCFDDVHVHRPENLRQLVQQLEGRGFIKDTKGYRAEREVLDKYDGLYRKRVETIEVDKLLSELPGKLHNADEKEYLEEAITCFRAQAFRAAIIMTWNVVYDHLVEVIVAKHLVAFNNAIATAGVQAHYQKKPPQTRDDFQKWKESDVIKVAYSANVFSKEVNKVLEDRLDRRNSAAHPSGSKVTKLNAEDYITDVINNALLKIS